MTILAPAFFAPGRGAQNPGFYARSMLILCLGGVIGTVVALALYLTKTAYVGLLPLGLAVALPAMFAKNPRQYWFAIFLLSLQFTISKNLNDGLAVRDALKIDYTIYDFTFEVTATDLLLLVLLAFWANDHVFHRKPLRFPAVTWLAIGYLGLCLLSLVGAPSPYLGLVEMSRQIKFFIVYLFAVNCLDGKSVIRVLAGVGVAILVTQAGMCVVRFATGFMSPLTFGNSFQDLSQVKEYLTVSRSASPPMLRAFGTLDSPGSAARLCMMVIPFALFLSVRNALFRMPLMFAVLSAFGLLGLVLMFTRAYYIVTAAQLALVFVIMLRDRMLKRETAVLIVMVGLAGLAVISPKLYEQFTVRESSVSVRFLQYEAAVKMIIDHPFLGVGLNNSTGQKSKYVNITYNQYDPDTQFDREPTHNLYLGMASEIGVFGTLLFVTFFARAALSAWRHSRRATDPEVRWLANALLVAFCGAAVDGLIDPIPEYQVLILLWLYAGISFNLPRMAPTTNTVRPVLHHRISLPAPARSSDANSVTR